MPDLGARRVRERGERLVRLIAERDVDVDAMLVAVGERVPCDGGWTVDSMCADGDDCEAARKAAREWIRAGDPPSRRAELESKGISWSTYRSRIEAGRDHEYAVSEPVRARVEDGLLEGLAVEYGVSVRTVQRWLKSGKISL